MSLAATRSCVLRDVPQVRLSRNKMFDTQRYIGHDCIIWPRGVCIIVQASPEADIGLINLGGRGLLVQHYKSPRERVITRVHTPMGTKIDDPFSENKWEKVYELTPEAAWDCEFKTFQRSTMASLTTTYVTLEEFVVAYCAAWPEGKGIVIENTLNLREKYSIAVCKHEGKLWLAKQDHN